MPKWLPKVMKNHPKWSPGAPRIDLFFVLSISEKAKKLDFSMRFWGDPKTRKIDPWSAKGAKKVSRETTSGRTGRRGGHGTRV